MVLHHQLGLSARYPVVGEAEAEVQQAAVLVDGAAAVVEQPG